MRPMPELKVVTVRTDDLVPYANNAKLHPHDQVDQIAASIEKFGNCDPIAVWHNDQGEMEIVEGHGRLMALKKLGIGQAPVIYLDHLTDEQRRAYMLVHNQLTMNSGFDLEMLDVELGDISSIDMGEFGFSEPSVDDFGLDDDEEKYSQKITTPIYEVKGENPDVSELYDLSTYERIVQGINDSDVDGELKQFLLHAASRHISFDYGKVAEFYAHQPKEVQELMEESTLVIVDFDKAIEMGCVKAAVEMNVMRGADIGDE